MYIFCVVVWLIFVMLNKVDIFEDLSLVYDSILLLNGVKNWDFLVIIYVFLWNNESIDMFDVKMGFGIIF